MKKHITLALWFMATLTAQAQYWVGGSVFIDRAKEEDTREYIDRTTTFNFELRPEFGYHLTDKVALGLSASYWHEYTHIVSTNYQPIVDQSQTYNAYSLTPFVRYYFNEGRFRLFTNGELPFNTSHNRGDEYTTLSLGLSLRPGAQYELCSRMGLLCYLGSLSYAHHWRDHYSSNTFNFSLSDELHLGIYFNL